MFKKSNKINKHDIHEALRAFLNLYFTIYYLIIAIWRLPPILNVDSAKKHNNKQQTYASSMAGSDAESDGQRSGALDVVAARVAHAVHDQHQHERD